MLKTYKILSLLLDYPDEALMEALPTVKEEIEKERLLYYSQLEHLDEFLSSCSSLSLGEWQMMYVQQFDCSKTVNLYLFDHVYGDSRDRGQAMVDLKEMYARSGFRMVSNELPDYLPLFLEYLSFLGSREKAVELLYEVKPVLSKIAEKLGESDNPYRHLFAVLLGLAESLREEMCV